MYKHGFHSPAASAAASVAAAAHGSVKRFYVRTSYMPKTPTLFGPTVADALQWHASTVHESTGSGGQLTPTFPAVGSRNVFVCTAEQCRVHFGMETCHVNSLDAGELTSPSAAPPCRDDVGIESRRDCRLHVYLRKENSTFRKNI